MVGVVGPENHLRLWPDQPAEERRRSIRDVPLEDLRTPRSSTFPSDGAVTFDPECQKKQPEGAALLAMLSSCAPSGFEPGANVRLCSYVEMEFLWQALEESEKRAQQFKFKYADAFEKRIELEAANNKLTDLVAALGQEPLLV